MNLLQRASAVLTGLTLMAALGGSALAAPPLQQYASGSIKTLSLSSQITTENQSELKKIPGDIALAYRLHRGSMQYTQPGMLRVETSVPLLGSGYYVVNGNRTLTVAPFVRKIRDVTGAPGKKQTLMEFGLIPPELFTDYNATFVRKDGADDIYNITPKQAGETFHHQVWIDPATKITVRREDYDRHGVLTKVILYKNPKEAAPGIFIPTRLELYNSAGKLAGVTDYQNIKVNQPISASTFSF
jgi:outer membrane lipoprotein-sorting protein